MCKFPNSCRKIIYCFVKNDEHLPFQKYIFVKIGSQMRKRQQIQKNDRAKKNEKNVFFCFGSRI